MSIIDDLKAYALTKVSGILDAAVINFSGTDYTVYTLISPSFTGFYCKAVLENALGNRSIFMPGQTIPLTMTNAQYIALIDSAANSYQQIIDVYNAIVALILSSTITTTGQIDSNWVSLTSAYVTNRISMPTIETVSNLVMRTWHTVSRSIVTNASASNGFQVSSTIVSDVIYDINFSCTASIGGNSTETIVLQKCSTNSSNPSDWSEVRRISNSQVLGLALTLSSNQGITVPLIGYGIEANKFVRILAVTVGTGSATVVNASERY